MKYMYKKVDSILEELSINKRLFMVIDFNSILFEFDFNKQIAPFFEKLINKYLSPKGAVAYGNSISRLTFKMTLKEINDKEKRFFKTKEQAFRYINELINKKKLDIPAYEGFNRSQRILETTPINLDDLK